jgi:GntR family transcriptional regulator
MVNIDPRSRIPIFEQIKNQITELIFLGILKPHDQITSIRALAQELKLNVNTVKKAFQDLESAGIIYTLSGRGSFVSENPPENERLKAKFIDEISHAIKTGRANGIKHEEVIEITKKIYKNAPEDL